MEEELRDKVEDNMNFEDVTPHGDGKGVTLVQRDQRTTVSSHLTSLLLQYGYAIEITTDNWIVFRKIATSYEFRWG